MAILASSLWRWGISPRARGASQFAKETGLSRETIYKSLRPGGNPTLDTFAKAVKVLGLRLSLTLAV